MSDELSDFFKLISVDKQKKKEKFNEMVGDLGLDSLFKDIAAEKKKVKEEKEKEIAEKIEEEQKKKEEFDQLLGDMSLDSLFGDLAKAKKEVTEDKEKEKKVLASFENFLNQKIDDIEEIKEELVEEVEPEEEIEEEVVEEEKGLIEKSLGLLSEPSQDLGIDKNFATLDDLQNHYREFLVKIQQQLSTLGGGGIEDAPKTGGPYARRNQAWETISSSAESSKLVLDVRNNNIGYALTIGTPVYQTSYNSGLDRLDVEESRASDSTTMPAKGVVSSDLANNTSGKIIVYGELEGVNTQAYDVGDELYVAPNGGLTNVRPNGENELVQKIAVVLKKSNANGAILVYGAGRTNDVPNSFSIEGNISAGIITATSTLHVGVDTGFFTEDLVVNGDARITGILTVGQSSVTIDGKEDKIIIGTGTTITESGNAEYVGVITARNVSIGNTFTYPEYITGGMVPRAIKSQGGYDRTSGFADYQTGTEASQDPADYIEYTQELADSDTWYRFGMTTAGNQARDNQWWGETNPNYDNTKGLFGGLTAPAGVNKFFDFSENTAFNNAQTSGSLKYTQALGSFSLKECQVGDLVLARFDFNIMPMVTNTTVQVALIYANRDASDNITFTFPLTITPFFYGSGSVGKGFLLRPTITAYMANQQDVNSRSLVAIKADNPILVNPIGVLFTIQR